MKKRTPTTAILARNLAFLMEDRGWTQVQTGKQAGVDQKVISYILSESKVPGLDVVDKIAAAFGLNMWHLIMPTLPEDLKNHTSIRQVYDAFFESGPEGRKHILQVAEREAEYTKTAS